MADRIRPDTGGVLSRQLELLLKLHHHNHRHSPLLT